MTCSAYIAKKNGGSDDGKLYAMKVLNIPHIMLFTGSENSLIHERKVTLNCHLIKKNQN